MRSLRAGDSVSGDLLTDDSHVLLSHAGRPVVFEHCSGMHPRVVVADLVRVTMLEHAPCRDTNEPLRDHEPLAPLPRAEQSRSLRGFGGSVPSPA